MSTSIMAKASPPAAQARMAFVDNIRFTVTRLVGGKPVAFKRLRVHAAAKAPTVALNGKPLRVRSSRAAGRFLELDVAVKFAKPGDRLEVTG